MINNNLIVRNVAWLAVLTGMACARPTPPGATTPQPADTSAAENGDTPPPPAPRDRTAVTGRSSGPAADPRVAMLAGLMPLSNTGADLFRELNPTFDGRGVLIGVLDSGVDAGLPGFSQTTTGEPKILDLRDFSGEGRIELIPVQPSGGSITIGPKTLNGFGHVDSLARGPFFGGVFRELPLDKVDVNANGNYSDQFALLVARTDRGWAVFADRNGDGSLVGEKPVHDYLVARETFAFTKNSNGRGPLTIAVNMSGNDQRPELDLFFDNSGHGSHVSGIATGRDMFGIETFDGVAPGAQLLAAKISNNARGGITVTGSMLRAMDYAAAFAQERGLPLILNLSFGVGNEVEGAATIDSMIDAFTVRNPNVLFVVSAGNEGPGVSSVGFPGSAEQILSACALFPGVFSGPRPQGFAIDSDGIAEFSSRGGELAKPDLCVPGIAYSNVPGWARGDEIKGGTSMAAPHLAGLAAMLQSARIQDGGAVRAVDLRQALVATAQQLRVGYSLDMGAGVPNVQAAHQWLAANHQAGVYSIRALADGGNTSHREGAYRRAGFASPSDTVQRFEVKSLQGQPAARLLLRSDQPWLRSPSTLEMQGGAATVEVAYRADRLRTPGLYVGNIWAVPASDTLAGPAFRLMNTIVVPQALNEPFVEARDLGPGRLRRYFFDIPETADGFVVEMELRYETQRGTLHLFEPNGQAFRGKASVDAGGAEGSKVRIMVGAADVVPGVYEAVISAPPRTALSYQLRAALPRYMVESIDNGPAATIRMRQNASEFIQDASVFQRPDSVSVFSDSLLVEARVLGATRSFSITGRRSIPESLTVRVPQWAGSIALSAELPEGLWNTMTDMGISVYDSVGVELGEGPLSYPVGRSNFTLDRWRQGEPLLIEVFPAFAALEAPLSWSATIDVTFLARRPADLAVTGADTTKALSMSPGQSVTVQFAPISAAWQLPPGFQHLLEVAVTPAGGAPAVRRQQVTR